MRSLSRCRFRLDWLLWRVIFRHSFLQNCVFPSKQRTCFLQVLRRRFERQLRIFRFLGGRILLIRPDAISPISFNLSHFHAATFKPCFVSPRASLYWDKVKLPSIYARSPFLARAAKVNAVSPKHATRNHFEISFPPRHGLQSRRMKSLRTASCLRLFQFHVLAQHGAERALYASSHDAVLAANSLRSMNLPAASRVSCSLNHRSDILNSQFWPPVEKRMHCEIRPEQQRL